MNDLRESQVDAPGATAGSSSSASPFVAALLLLLALTPGCGGGGDSQPAPSGLDGSTLSQENTSGLLEIAIDNLNRQEDYPSGDMLSQIVDQLNQWVRGQTPPADWRPDPALEGLPSPLGELPGLDGLDQLVFRRSDGIALQEATWLRNVAGWARGGQLDDLSRACRLFDWTVRNIQLEPIAELSSGHRLYRLPWETLLLGRGAMVERAWVFLLLARQQGLDAAMLALPDPDDPAQGPPRPWAVGVLIEGEIYLFDPALGMPVPADDGVRLGASGGLDIRPATLAEVAANDALLRRLDLEAQRPYPLRSSDLAQLIALVEASPSYLAVRMELIQSQLTGQRKMVLTTSPTDQMRRWTASPQIAEARLWRFPYYALLDRASATQEQSQERTVAMLPLYAGGPSAIDVSDTQEPTSDETEMFYKPRRTSSDQPAGDAPLYRARLLHLKGQLIGPQGATVFYQQARPSDEQLDALAAFYYQSALAEAADLPPDEQPTPEQMKQVAAERAAIGRAILNLGKQNASYWLGLLNFDQALLEQQQGNDAAAAAHLATAVDYLAKRTLAASPDGPWTHGAEYNLGRTYEALGDYGEAITRYTVDANSPAVYGNFLRARWLDALRPGSPRPAAEVEPEEPIAPEPAAEEPTVEEPVAEEPVAAGSVDPSLQHAEP